MILEVDVSRARGKTVGDAREGKVVSRNQPDSSAVEESAHDAFGSDPAVV
jgi:hypothetical protein